MKKFYICLLALLVVSFQAGAKEQGKQGSDYRKDSLQTVAKKRNSCEQSAEQRELDRAIWKKRAKYFNIGYVSQKLTDKTHGGYIKSDFGVSLSNGQTYYLHKKPLFGMMKFGLDWSWLDINYAKSSIPYLYEESDETFSSAIHQAELGMQFGPSVTINPIDHLKISVYFRVTPSYSLLYLDETIHHHYEPFLNTGLTVAWRVISLGAEWRWGTAKYSGMTFDDSMFDDSMFDDSDFGDDSMDDFPSLDDVVKNVPKQIFKTSSFRVYIGFRF